jgi:hypothetical protein
VFVVRNTVFVIAGRDRKDYSARIAAEALGESREHLKHSVVA